MFYLGDGEQTTDLPPQSFAALAAYLDGGAVLGYGTSEGGPMPEFFPPTDLHQFGEEEPEPDPEAETSYIQDPAGGDAISRIDEAALQTIANASSASISSAAPRTPRSMLHSTGSRWGSWSR